MSHPVLSQAVPLTVVGIWTGWYIYSYEMMVHNILRFLVVYFLLSAPICPPGWIPFAHTNECYHFDDNKMNYETARAYCKDLSSTANMVVARDGLEQSFLNGEPHFLYYL